MSKKEKQPKPQAEALEVPPVASPVAAPLAPQAPALALATPAAASDVIAPNAFRILVEGVPRALKRRVRIY